MAEIAANSMTANAIAPPSASLKVRFVASIRLILDLLRGITSMLNRSAGFFFLSVNANLKTCFLDSTWEDSKRLLSNDYQTHF